MAIGSQLTANPSLPMCRHYPFDPIDSLDICLMHKNLRVRCARSHALDIGQINLTDPLVGGFG